MESINRACDEEKGFKMARGCVVGGIKGTLFNANTTILRGRGSIACRLPMSVCACDIKTSKDTMEE